MDELSSLESKHRKEKKELQAQLQALKKAAKNDKTKKKELAAEISKLETEMDARHKQELESIQKDTEEVTDSVINIENEVAKVKISKAQKRRDKKSLQEKEREEQIKQQEQENLHGPRNMELQEISVKLKERGLEIFLIPSDGDCLYKAIAHQMLVTKRKEVSVEELRKNVSDYIRAHKDDFIPFMSNPDTFEMLTDDEFEEYCNKIENTKVWGGQLEIRALSNLLKCPISVLQASGPNSIDQGTEFEGTPLIITYHRHMYRLGEHYNSTVGSSKSVAED
ncbi:deubiquitinase OTUD6B-like [Trichoplusia ni]|uniref:ubiquitinyl hydrolase 1 n=1 Tax=Trichoplusia ni TaxID=7111 RepID=A0A7E5VG09_TRINI|nr:deubiquitinase OTUD6B-like [Trichoplusia ni]XP_026727238.1 deubiquitinase OTUD6B-like [Trichoplusia ni]